MKMGFSAVLPIMAGLALAGCGSPEVTLSPDGDILTPAGALAHVRRLRAGGEFPVDRAVTIAVKPGRYHVGDGLLLTAEDSNVRFVGVSAKECVFDGGVRLPGFRCRSDSIWETDAPVGFDFDQLWVNGLRATRARSPNAGYHYMVDMDNDEPRRNFYIEPNIAEILSRLPDGEIERVRFQIWQNWDTGYVTVDSVDPATGHVAGHNQLLWPFFRSVRRETPRYVVENFRAALDAPGEWFHDMANGKILYVPRSGETLEESVAVVPKAAEILLVSGAHDVAFEGIGFEHSRWTIGRSGVSNLQSAYLTTNAAIVVERSQRVAFRNVRLSHAGSHGVWFADGTEDSVLDHSLVEDVGACGVRIGPSRSAVRRAPKEDEISRHIRVEDSIVRSGGREEEGASGIFLTHAADCSIVHNDICDFYYTGVSAGFTWGYSPTFVRNNRIAFNNLHHLNQGRLADMAGIYTLGCSLGTVVHGNWIHDITGYRHTFPTWGLYSDEGSQGVLFVSNLVERCAEAAIHQNYGRDNVYDGNVLIGFDRHGIRRSRREKHLSVTFRNNVFVWDDPTVPFLESPHGQPTDDMVFSNNLACCRSGSPAGLPEGVKPLPEIDLRFADAIRNGAGVLRSDSEWVDCAKEKTWRQECKIPDPPRYRSRSIVEDFMRFPPGIFRLGRNGTYGQVKVHSGNPGAFAIGEIEAKRALRISDSSAEKVSWMPHMYMEFAYFDCVVDVRFCLRLGRGSRIGCEVRDFFALRGKPNAFVSGSAFHFDEGNIPVDTWVDVRLTLDMPHRKWQVVAGDWHHEGVFSDERFKTFSWIGFVSEGLPDSVWWIGDIKIERKEIDDAP